MKCKYACATCVFGLSLIGLVPCAQGAVYTATETVTANVNALGKIRVLQGNVSLTPSSTTFGGWTGSVNLEFKIRTGTSGGSIQIQFGDFTGPVGGPALSALSYTCPASSIGGRCAGGPASTALVQLISIPPSTCTGAGCAGTDPQTARIDFSLKNSETYPVGSYSTLVTFTFSNL